MVSFTLSSASPWAEVLRPAGLLRTELLRGVHRGPRAEREYGEEQPHGHVDHEGVPAGGELRGVVVQSALEGGTVGKMVRLNYCKEIRSAPFNAFSSLLEASNTLKEAHKILACNSRAIARLVSRPL